MIWLKGRTHHKHIVEDEEALPAYQEIDFRQPMPVFLRPTSCNVYGQLYVASLLRPPTLGEEDARSISALPAYSACIRPPPPAYTR